MEANAGNSLLVTFTLTTDGARTRLRIVESGLHDIDWPRERKATYMDEHSRV